MTISGTPSRAISTACACQSWWGAKRRRTPARAAARRSSARAPLVVQGRPRVRPDAEQRTDRQRDACVEPRLKLLPSPIVHTDFATSPSLAATNDQRTAAAIEVRFAQRERFVDAQAGAPEHHDQPAKPPAVPTVAKDAHDRDDLLDGGRVGWIAQAFVARRMTGVKARHCRRRAPTTGGIENR